MKSLEKEFNQNLFSHMALLAGYYFPKQFKETIDMYSTLLMEHYKDLRSLNPGVSRKEATEWAYKNNFEALVIEGQNKLPN